MTGGRFVRVAETDRREMTIVVDGKPIRALEGDTLLVAILGTRTSAHVRIRRRPTGGVLFDGCLSGLLALERNG